MLSKKIENVRISVVANKLIENKVDLIYLWTTSSLTEGDEVFVETHKEAGSQVFRECQNYLVKFGNNTNGRTEIAVGKSIITNAGMLKYIRFIIHSVIPNHRIPTQKNNKLAIMLQALSQSLIIIDEYSKINLVRKIGIPSLSETIYGEITDNELKQVITVLIQAIKKNQLSKVKEFIFVCPDEETRKQYEKVLIDLASTWYEKILIKLFGQ